MAIYDDAWLAAQLAKPGGCRLIEGTRRPALPADAAEADLQGRLHQLCTQLGYLYFHTTQPKRSTAGLPDALILHPDGGPLYCWELKRTGEHPSPAQRRWLDALAQATGIASATYWPNDWERIVAQLLRR
jgi:hypothetical protein